MKFRALVSLEGRAWSASLLNVGAMALQLWTVWSTKDASGLSFGMLGIFLYVQLTFTQVGKKTGQKALFWGMLLSSILTATILVYALYLRS